MHFTRRTLITAALLSAGLPTAAHASVLRVENGTVIFEAAPGERNNASVGVNPFVGDANRYTASDDGATLTPGPGCEAEEFYGRIVCQLPGPAPVVANVGDGDDKLQLSVPGIAIGGPGNDILSGSPTPEQRFDGGPGDDTINGDDTGYCTAGHAARGPDVISGGEGVDTASYEADVGPVRVTIDGAPDDGAGGEGDNVLTDVENVLGTGCAANDITGSAAPNALTGRGVLTGLGGDDVLFGSGSDDVLTGGDGNDKLTAFGGNDALDGGAGDDFLEGGFDDDRLTGGPGTDSFVGDETRSNTIGTGNDTILANDGIKENVSCGPGSDVAELDALDVVPIDTQNLCETVRRAAGGPAPGPGPGPVGPTKPAARSVSASGLKLVSKRRKIRVKVTCALTAQPGCVGTVRLLGGSKKISLTSRRTLSLAPKKSRTLTLTLTKSGRSLVRKSKKTSVVVLTVLRTASGVKTTRQTLSVKR